MACSLNPDDICANPATSILSNCIMPMLCKRSSHDRKKYSGISDMAHRLQRLQRAWWRFEPHVPLAKCPSNAHAKAATCPRSFPAQMPRLSHATATVGSPLPVATTPARSPAMPLQPQVRYYWAGSMGCAPRALCQQKTILHLSWTNCNAALVEF